MTVLKYGQIVYGKLNKRINRFIAEVYIDGVIEQVHIKNTGRLKELLLSNAHVVLEVSDNPTRKTRYSLIAVAKDSNWVNIDSQAPNAVAFEAMKAGKLQEFGAVQLVKKEVTYGKSRFDLYFEKLSEKLSDNGCKGIDKGFIEVKGVTLNQDGIAMFPDAPTSRGTKHVLELIEAVNAGYTCAILFLVQIQGCHTFSPNRTMDAKFADAVLEASRQGVQILAYDSIVKENELLIGEQLPVCLS